MRCYEGPCGLVDEASCLIELLRRVADHDLRAVNKLRVQVYEYLTQVIVGKGGSKRAIADTHNRDGFSDASPPYNLHPGANSTVYSVAVQPDGNAILVHVPA